MKILLINPYLTFHPGTESKAFGGPMGLAYLAGMCQKNGHEVKILDMYGYGIDRRTILEDGCIRVGLDAEDLRKFVLEYGPKVVGVSSNYTDHEQDALDALRMVKEINSDIFNVVGGANATARPDIMMEHDCIDCLIQGEGEHLLIDVLSGLDCGASDFENVYYRKQGKIIKKDKGERIKDLDALPLPARHLLSWKGDSFIKLYAERYPWAKRKRSAPIVTSRGCPFTCSFCSVEGLMGRSYVVRSAQNVFDEIKYLHGKYQIEEFHFYDDIFTIQKKRLIELCRLGAFFLYRMASCDFPHFFSRKSASFAN